MNKRQEAEAIWDAVNARDFEAFAELLHPEAEFRSVIGASKGEVHFGIDGIRKWTENIDETWADQVGPVSGTEKGP